MTSMHAETENYRLSIIIPIYNEQDNIKETLYSIEENIDIPCEIITVYDHPTDTTLPILKDLQEHFVNLKVTKNDIATGPSGAIRTGLNAASAPLILVMMADLCDDISQVQSFMDLAAKDADIVCPSRYCEGGRQDISGSPKKWLPKIAGFILHNFVGLPYDPTNSFKLYSKEVLDEIDLKSTSSFSVTLEIVAKAHCLGYRLVEIPTTWKDRKYGKSNFNLIFSIFSYLPWFILALTRGKFHRRFNQKYRNAK